MYVITDQLKEDGFSTNRLDYIFKRNNGIRKINTLEYYSIYIILENVRINVEGQVLDIHAGNMVFVGPQKNIEFSNCNGNNILAIAFSSSFYERSLKDSLLLNSQIFFNYRSQIFISPLLHIDEMRVIFLDRMERFKNKDKTLYISAAHNAIERLILDAFSHITDEDVKKNVQFDYLYYANRFKVLLQRDYKEFKKVSHYANELNISSRKLTEMTEYILGKTAKQIIIEKIVDESKRLLQHSDYTISQISYELGFTNEGNYTNFLKKHTGKSPSMIR
ncbi:helix-turn-helix domain-containing protein [Chryseobacterium takakiae]|uniref:AraC-type DNA-binding protein n=1 Tax=Chryseobacterium takakiae TaxID=1302685 RepID=A0A1M5ASS7_9FLAO|nr:helix-turn-helix domain-containing protein [Chryseobacterium takakiae]SHF33289.1 AraC-type DNA-binding protein [Chryseobacterium takakiae]